MLGNRVDVLTHVVVFGDVNTYLSAELSGLDLRYPMPGDHPLPGGRVPDADINSAAGDKRFFDLLVTARPVVRALAAGGCRVAGLEVPWAVDDGPDAATALTHSGECDSYADCCKVGTCRAPSNQRSGYRPEMDAREVR